MRSSKGYSINCINMCLFVIGYRTGFRTCVQEGQNLCLTFSSSYFNLYQQYDIQNTISQLQTFGLLSHFERMSWTTETSEPFQEFAKKARQKSIWAITVKRWGHHPDGSPHINTTISLPLSHLFSRRQHRTFSTDKEEQSASTAHESELHIGTLIWKQFSSRCLLNFQFSLFSLINHDW